MSDLQLVPLRSPEELLEHGDQWDDLWRRSRTGLVTAKSRALATWLEQFVPGKDFRAVVVAQGPLWVAAIPFYGDPLGPLLRGRLPGNEWAPGGQLLLDPDVDSTDVCEKLISGLEELPWPLLWLEGIRYEEPAVTKLVAALDRRGWEAELKPDYPVGLLGTEGDWEQYRSGLSRNHRKHLGRSLRRLNEIDEVKLRVEQPRTYNDCRDLIEEGFEVEDRSWKGQSGSSVIQTPGMLQYYQRLAEHLTDDGFLRLSFLDCGDRRLAFEFGWLANHVYHSFKVGYDPEFARFSSGQVLVYLLLEQFFQAKDVRAVDCMGPVTEAIVRWRGNEYQLGRLIIAPPRLLGRGLMYAYRHIWPQVKKLRRTPAQPITE